MRNKVTRKKVIRTRALAAAVAVSMLTGLCPMTARAVSGSEVAADGSYMATATATSDRSRWDSYDVTVTLKVENGKFAEIEVTPGDTYDSINDSFLNAAVSADTETRKGIQTVLTGETASEDAVNSWDTVSRATITSAAIKEAALEAIQSAPGNYVIDTSELANVIAAAEALVEVDYTADSWAAMGVKLTEAKNALTASSQAEVDQAASDLNQAISELVKADEDPITEIDTASLVNAIATAEGLAEGDYTSKSWNTLQTALAAAKVVLADKESQEAVDAALLNLQEAIDGLVKADEDPVVDVDTTALEKAIAAAEALKESDYTADSWKALQTALTAAKSALETKESQEAVDAATTALNSAISSLVKASTSGTGTTNSTNSSNASSAKTGDSSNVLLWLILAIAALAAGGFAWKRKTNMK